MQRAAQPCDAADSDAADWADSADSADSANSADSADSAVAAQDMDDNAIAAMMGHAPPRAAPRTVDMSFDAHARSGCRTRVAQARDTGPAHTQTAPSLSLSYFCLLLSVFH